MSAPAEMSSVSPGKTLRRNVAPVATVNFFEPATVAAPVCVASLAIDAPVPCFNLKVWPPRAPYPTAPAAGWASA